MMNTNFRVGLYCRLSSDDGNVGDSGSIITQKMILEKYCEENNLQIIDTYVDDGFSGLNYNRPSFQRLMSDIEIGRINMVITKDLSRLGRDYIQTGYYTEIYFPTKHVRYVAITDNVDTSSNNNDIAPFKNILNDMYAKDLSRKVKIAKRQRAMNGYFISCQAPFGYMKDPNNHNKLIIDPEAAPIVRRMFDMALQKIGAPTIAKIFTKEGIPTPGEYKAMHGDTRFDKTEIRTEDNGKKGLWVPVTVNKILKDMVYVGDMENRKYEVENYKTKKRVRVPDDQHIIVKNTHEPIISREEYAEVQEILKSRVVTKRHNSENLFKSLVFCECGRRMGLIHKFRKDGTLKQKYYICQGHINYPKICTQSNQIKYDTVKQLVDKRLRLLISQIKNNNEIFSTLNDEIKKNNNTKEKEETLKRHKARFNTLINITKNLYEDYSARIIDAITYKTLLNDYQVEQKELTKKIKKLEEEIRKIPFKDNSFEKLREVAFKYIDEIEINKDMVNDLISKIVIGYKKKEDGVITREIKIIYKFIEMSLD